MARSFRVPPRLVLRRTALVSLIIATVVVAALIPWRRHALRTGSDAFVPFRGATAGELATLLKHEQQGKAAAWVTRLDGDEVEVTTGSFVAEGPLAGVTAASWENFLLSHRIARADLEQALGRKLTATDVKEAPGKVSFVSNDWPIYAAQEVMLVALLLGALLLVVYVVRSLLLLPIFLVGWIALYVGAVMLFAPAFFDADSFHQRVAIEMPAPYLILAGFALVPVAVLATASFFARRLSRKLVLVPIVAAVGALVLYYNDQYQATTRDLKETAEQFDTAALARLAGAPELTDDVKTKALRVVDGIEPARTVYLYVPTKSGRWIFVAASKMRSDYVDVRDLGEVIGSRQLNAAWQSGYEARTGFLDWSWDLVRNWRARMTVARVLKQDGRPVALVTAMN